MKLPICSGHWHYSSDGDDYDCDSLHNKPCESCLAYYKTYGGLWNPDTGKRTSIFLANILYGGNK